MPTVSLTIMRVFGLDIGERRIGIAVADTTTRVANPVRVMDAREVVDNASTWRLLLEDYEPELLVCGLPKTMKGVQGRQAHSVREVAERISAQSKLPLDFVDERMSSAQAKRLLHEQGLSEREMRGKIDSVAASLFLETWLDSRIDSDSEER